MGARAIAWCTLIMISLIIVTALYFVTSSGIAFFESEAKDHNEESHENKDLNKALHDLERAVKLLRGRRPWSGS